MPKNLMDNERIVNATLLSDKTYFKKIKHQYYLNAKQQTQYARNPSHIPLYYQRKHPLPIHLFTAKDVNYLIGIPKYKLLNLMPPKFQYKNTYLYTMKQLKQLFHQKLINKMDQVKAYSTLKFSKHYSTYDYISTIARKLTRKFHKNPIALETVLMKLTDEIQKLGYLTKIPTPQGYIIQWKKQKERMSWKKKY